jgi:hypothetical protein
MAARLAGMFEGGSEMDFVRSRLGVLALAALVGACSVSSVGCGKKDEKKTEEESSSKKSKDKSDDEKGDDKPGKKTKKKAKSAADDDDDTGDKKPEKSGKSGKYTQGDVLKHVPKDCAMLKLYVDTRALQKNEGFAANADALQEKLASSMKDDDAEKGQKVLKALKKAGIDPTKDVREIAMCGESKDDFVLAIGGEFAGKEPLDAISKAIEATGDDAPKTVKSGDLSMLSFKGKKRPGFLGEVAPGVLVIADDKETVASLQESNDRASDWNVGTDRIAVFNFREKAKLGFDFTLSSKDDAVEGKFVGTFEDSTGDKMKKAPKAFEAEFTKMAVQFSTKMEKGPFKAVAADVKATKVTVSDNVVTVTMSIANDHLAKLIKALAEATPADLEKAMR